VIVIGKRVVEGKVDVGVSFVQGRATAFLVLDACLDFGFVEGNVFGFEFENLGRGSGCWIVVFFGEGWE
jgi:hypothetical protein